MQLAPALLESITSIHRLSSIPLVLKVENLSNDKHLYLGVQFNGSSDVIEVPKLAAEYLGKMLYFNTRRFPT